MRQGFEKLGLSHQPTTQSQRMNIHTNARLTPRSREALVLAVINRRLTAKAAAVAFALSERTARKWIARFRAEGMAGLADRSSRPRRSPRQIPTSPNRGRPCAAPTAHARLPDRTPKRPLQGEYLAYPASSPTSSPTAPKA